MSNIKAWWTRKAPDIDLLLFGFLMVAVGRRLLILLLLPMLAR